MREIDQNKETDRLSEFTYKKITNLYCILQRFSKINFFYIYFLFLKNMEMKKADFLENLFILKLFDGRGHHFQENKSENQKKKINQ